MVQTFNFRLEHYDYKVEARFCGNFRDMRNNIDCSNPTADIQCYLNYIEYLNLNRQNWKSYGYLDLGMMPLVMAPSFLHSSLIDPLVTVANKFNLKVYNMPPISLLCETCKVTEEDIWVFKSDVAKLTGMREEQVNIERFLAWCFTK